jgi:ABC-type lipoprotein export system ATPase subunit
MRRDRAGHQRTVLRELSARFGPGRCTLLLGPTGSGKTTLLHLLAGLLLPTAGEVLAAGEPVSRWRTAHRDRWRRQVGLCFQRSELWPELSALENVLVPMVPLGMTLGELRRRGRGALARVGAEQLAARPAGELSVGERQRVELARALALTPRYLLADEPTAHQDDLGLQTVERVLTEEARRGATVVVAAHDPRVLEAQWAGPTYRLAQGRLSALEESGKRADRGASEPVTAGRDRSEGDEGGTHGAER